MHQAFEVLDHGGIGRVAVHADQRLGETLDQREAAAGRIIGFYAERLAK